MILHSSGARFLIIFFFVRKNTHTQAANSTGLPFSFFFFFAFPQNTASCFRPCTQEEVVEKRLRGRKKNPANTCAASRVNSGLIGRKSKRDFNMSDLIGWTSWATPRLIDMQSCAGWTSARVFHTPGFALHHCL